MLARIAVLILALGLVLPADAQQTSGAQSPAISVGRDAIVTYGFTPEQVQGPDEGSRIRGRWTTGGQDRRFKPEARHYTERGIDVAARAWTAGCRRSSDCRRSSGRSPPNTSRRSSGWRHLIRRTRSRAISSPARRTAITAGHLKEADQLLSQAEQIEITAAHQAQQLAQQAKEPPISGCPGGQRAAHAGNIAMTELHYLDAAQHFQDAADLVPPGHPDDKGRFLLAEANALQQQGDERGDNAALAKAISVYQLAANENTRERVPLDWAMTQNNLGNAL